MVAAAKFLTEATETLDDPTCQEVQDMLLGMLLKSLMSQDDIQFDTPDIQVWLYTWYLYATIINMEVSKP
jgi:hypothetical protein